MLCNDVMFATPPPGSKFNVFLTREEQARKDLNELLAEKLRQKRLEFKQRADELLAEKLRQKRLEFKQRAERRLQEAEQAAKQATEEEAKPAGALRWAGGRPPQWW